MNIVKIHRLRWKNICPDGAAFHIARIAMTGTQPCRVHTHDYAEVLWIEDGAGLHELNGKRLPLTRGTFVAIRPSDRHGFRNFPESSGFTIVNVAFPRETLDFLRARYFPNAKTFFWAGTPQPFQTTLNSSRLRWLQGWTDHLARAPHTRLEIERFLMDLLADLMSITRVASGPDWLRHALTQIREPQHFASGTPALAKLAGRTPQHVNRALREHLGMTATDAVNEARLDHAAMQLRMSTEKIITICLECGFQNLGHFYQVFRRRFGTTPRLYRLRHQAVVPATRTSA